MEWTENLYEQRLVYINKRIKCETLYLCYNCLWIAGVLRLQLEIRWFERSVVTWERTYSRHHLLKNSRDTFWTFIDELISFINRWTVPLLRSGLAPIFVSVGISISRLQPARINSPRHLREFPSPNYGGSTAQPRCSECSTG
jgi:hypothetical protein